MADNSSTNPSTGGFAPTESSGKGKGKAVDPVQDVSMEEDDDDSDEESGVEAEVEEPEEEDEDNMEEIDTANIITDGRRTRGRNIDFANAAQTTEGLDDDEDDDEDFEEPQADQDAMEH